MPTPKPSWANASGRFNRNRPVRDSSGRFAKKNVSNPNQGTLFDADDLTIPVVGPSKTVASDSWDYYWPTKSSNPPRPRTTTARYSSARQRMEVTWRDPGAVPYHYDNVPPEVWYHFKRVDSPGKFINSHLNNYPYGPGGWGTPDVD